MPADPRRRNLWPITIALLMVSFFVSAYTPVTFLFFLIPLAFTPFAFRRRTPRKNRDDDQR